MDFFENADALKSNGTYKPKFGLETANIVCGDRLCTEIDFEPRPNIIVIQVDDLDVLTLDLLIENNLMPNLKNNLIDKGTTFTNSFVTNSLCCPSRATLLTGLYSHNHGVISNYQEQGISQFNDKATISTWLKESDYITGFIGKYLNYYGVYTEPTYIPSGWDNWQALVEPSTYQVYNYTINDNGNLVTFGIKESDYQTDVLSRKNSEFIKNLSLHANEKPFFLLTSIMVPHKELVTSKCDVGSKTFNLVRGPPRYEGFGDLIDFPNLPSLNEQNIRDKPPLIKKMKILNEKNLECLEKIFHGRIESTLSIDDLIGDLIKTLKETSQLTNTVIFFTSDNGFLLGQHRIISKLVPYEESIRVPLIIKDPNYKKTTVDKLVLNNDLAPTIIEYGKAKANIKMDGVSLIDLIKNSPQTNWREGFLIEHFRGAGLGNFSIRTSSTIYTQWGDNSIEFYDLNRDPYQLNSLHFCSSEKCLSELESHS